VPAIYGIHGMEGNILEEISLQMSINHLLKFTVVGDIIP
jgi:hypothetical protein